MRLTLSLSFLLLTALPLAAAEPTTPNRLTPQEIADGWLLLFDGETTFGWAIDGPAKVEKGVLHLGGDKPVKASVSTHFLSNHQIRAEWDWEGTKEPNLRISSITAEMAKPPPGKEFASIEATYTGGTVLVVRSPVEISAPAGTRIRLRNLKLRPTETTPIFNGKSLAAWKEFPGRKSKFTVTDKGELNVKDGPGDLQTEGQWADFVLQLDCLSNGKHLNSGLFFRCNPGEYQQGYEMQIRNQWEGDDRSKPVDFGTGAIYRRQPARKVVSSDNEWFTMTLVAHGNHFATWVNGYQVVDWTDPRPPNKNARNGSNLDKGPISIQGHDPTTDLSFRNLRIAELPRGEKK